MEIPALDRDHPSWREAEIEHEFWKEHQQEFLATYPEQFVAVADRRVVLTSPDLQQLIAGLQNQGRDVRDVWIRYMHTDPSKMLL